MNEVTIVVTSKDQTGPGFDSAVGGAGRLRSALSNVASTAAGFLSANLFQAGLSSAMNFFGSSTQMASDLNEALNKSNTVFGSQGAAMEAWASTAASSMGLAKGAALDAAGGFGNMFDQLGIGEDQSASMSQTITGLASDFSSFHNADITEVLEAQSAAFRGEYDSIQRFLPLLNAAAVQTKAMEMTGKDNADQLTEQEKALATYELMLSGAGDAMGDFARTSEGAANQERIAAAETENLQAQIGQKLLPVTQAITRAKLALVGVLADKVLPVFEEVGGGVKAFFAAFKDGGDDVTSSGLAGWFERFGIVARNVFDQVSEKVREWWPKIQEAFNQVVETVREVWPDVQRIISDVMTTVGSVVSSVVEIITTLWENFGDNILDYVQRVWPRIQQIIHGALEIIRGIFEFFSALIQGKWGEAWDALLGILHGAWTLIQGVLGAAFEQVRTIFSIALEILGGMWSGLWEGIKTALSNAWGFIVGIFNSLVEFVGGLPGQIAEIAGNMWEGLKSGLASAVNWVLEKIEGMVNGLIDAYNKIPVAPDIGGISLPRVTGPARAVGTAPRGSTPRGGFAHGGITSGWTMVGEHGRELLNLPAGSTIRSNPDTERMLAGGGGGGRAVLELRSSGAPIDDLLVEILRRSIKHRGGNVQLVLGRN